MAINYKQSKLGVTKLSIVLLISFVLIVQANYLMAAEIWFDSDLHESNKVEVKLFDDSQIVAKSGKLVFSRGSKINKQDIEHLNSLAGSWQPVFTTKL